MIRRALSVAAALGVGVLFAAALYWGLLNTPESNAMMLALSALLVLTIVAATAVTVTTAVFAARGTPLRDALAAAPRATGWFAVAFAPLVLAWIAIWRFDAWMIQHSGELGAWFIAQFGWADISRLFQAELWISRWLRWAALPVACLSLLAALIAPEPATRFAWVRRALHWRTLLFATLVFVLLFALPWQLTAWRPQLPATWVQPFVAALRLGVVFVLALAGVAVLVLISSQDPANRAD